MKQFIKIRQGIFETNSSSSHSFSMGPEGRFGAKLEIDENGVINVSGGSWNDLSNEKSNDPGVKLSYLLSFAWTISGAEDGDLWEKHRDAIYKVILDFTGAKKISFTPGEEVDHQSTDIIDPRDLTNPEFIKEFVFNEGTWIYILWDSDCPDDSFYESTESQKALYKISFNLPGVDPDKTSLVLSYSGASNFESEVYNFMLGFVYLPDKGIFKELQKDEIPPSGSWIYKGEFKFGDNHDEISIDLPKIELV